MRTIDVKAIMAGLREPQWRMPMKNEWKEAVIEELIAWCILTEADEGDPRAAVKKLCEWERTVALDPAVSEPAAKLHAEIDRLRVALERIAKGAALDAILIAEKALKEAAHEH